MRVIDIPKNALENRDKYYEALAEVNNISPTVEPEVIVCGSGELIEMKEVHAVQVLPESIEEIAEAVAKKLTQPNKGTWLGNYTPYKCDKCGKHADSKTPFCAWCGDPK